MQCSAISHLVVLTRIIEVAQRVSSQVSVKKYSPPLAEFTMQPYAERQQLGINKNPTFYFNLIWDFNLFESRVCLLLSVKHLPYV